MHLVIFSFAIIKDGMYRQKQTYSQDQVIKSWW
jgi:hypothetical protein